jgi:curved DNA-binding protein CbpA
MTDRILEAYRALGVDPSSAMDEIQAAFRDLVKAWHPDRYGHDPKLRREAEAKLKEINQAYTTILDHVYRKPAVGKNLESTGPKEAYREGRPAKSATSSRTDSNRLDWFWTGFVILCVLFAVGVGVFVFYSR